MSHTAKKMISLRLSEEDLLKLDILSKTLSDDYKINFDRTRTIEYCIRWEYDKKHNTNKTSEYIENIMNATI